MVRSFQKSVWDHYRAHGRHELPWRNLPAGRQGRRDPYKILVSEVMLQQTQVERVVPYYKAFLKKFPTARALSRAGLSDVLKMWQGLGYNRRAKMLWLAAKEVSRKYKGKFPKTVEELEELPGVGPYTARAVAAFAYNQDVIFIETNIRTAVIYHFFSQKKGRRNTTIYRSVSDAQIEKILTAAFPRGRAREWYAALMDYGAHLKRSGVKLNAKSKHYTKQSTFAGSGREARGAILRELARASRAEGHLLQLLGKGRRAQVRAAIGALAREGMIKKNGRVFTLPRS